MRLNYVWDNQPSPLCVLKNINECQSRVKHDKLPALSLLTHTASFDKTIIDSMLTASPGWRIHPKAATHAATKLMTNGYGRTPGDCGAPNIPPNRWEAAEALSSVPLVPLLLDWRSFEGSMQLSDFSQTALSSQLTTRLPSWVMFCAI